MEKNLNRKVNFLLAYAAICTFAAVFLFLSSFKQKNSIEKFDELTVKKITVTGEDNLPRIVISNETRQNPGRMLGQNLKARERPAGIIFFNNQGDECGGIISAVSDEKGNVNNNMSFTMDNYHDDQIIQILNDETYQNGKATIQRGIAIKEYPLGTDILKRNDKFEEIQKIADAKTREEKTQELKDKEGSKNRLFVGRDLQNDTGLFLYDPAGKIKMKIFVDKKGDPKIQTFDNKGTSKDFNFEN